MRVSRFARYGNSSAPTGQVHAVLTSQPALPHRSAVGSAGANRDSPRRRLKSANTTPTQGLAIFGMKRRKDVKIFTRALTLTSLAAFTFFFAASTPAQKFKRPTPATSAKPLSAAEEAAVAEKQTRKTAATPDATNVCSYPFSTGSDYTYMEFCVTVNGNFSSFQGPYGHEMLSPDGSYAYEGYGICDVTNGNTEYYDYEYTDSGNWNAPTTVTHNATEVKIERTTSDGAWTLTQTISKVTGTTPYAKIVMALKNSSAETKTIYLLRYANAVPPTGLTYAQNYDGSDFSAWGYVPNYIGMLLENIGSPTPTSVTDFDQFGYSISGISGPAPCDYLASHEGTLTDAVGSVAYLYVLELNKNQTVTVTNAYRAF
jgi:hypothetical protein